MSLVIAVDFDGTLYVDGKLPFPHVDVECLDMNLIHSIEKAQKLRPDDKYILWTCRCREYELQCALSALNKVSCIRWDAINDNVSEVKARFGNPRKVVADIYLDDRAATPNSIEDFISLVCQKGDDLK